MMMFQKICVTLPLPRKDSGSHCLLSVSREKRAVSVV
jgi:hypothetical protein